MRCYLIIFLLLLIFRSESFSQKIEFNEKTDIVKLKAGDTVVISSDSAFVISGNRADYLNQRLNELDTIRRLFEGLEIRKTELISQVQELNDLLDRLKTEMVNDSIRVRGELSAVISDLESIGRDLHVNNQSLRQNNEELRIRIDRLNSLIKDLKKELRWIWWNGLTDKIVVFVSGAGIGALTAVLLL